MARIKREDVTEYSDISEDLEMSARNLLKEVLSAYDFVNPGDMAQSKQIWAEVTDAMQAIFGEYGSRAAFVGTTFYQRCRDIETDYTGTYVAEPYMDDSLYGRMTKRAHTVMYNARRGKISDGQEGRVTNERVIEQLCDVLGDNMMRANRDAVKYNMKREEASDVAYSKRPETARYVKPENQAKELSPSSEEDWEELELLREEDLYYRAEKYETELPKGREAPGLPDRKTQKETKYTYPHTQGAKRLRFMRVPRPDCKCSFCITLASRGAVYLTRERAGGHFGDEVNQFHDHCRCAIVPVESNNPFIDGYYEEMGSYLDTYSEAHDALTEVWAYKRDEGLTWEEIAESDEDGLAKRIADAYVAHKAKYDADPENVPKWNQMNEVAIAMRYQNKGMT